MEKSTTEASANTNPPATRLTRKLRRALRKEFPKKEEEPSLHSLDMSVNGLKRLQDENETLVRVKEAANGHSNSADVGFCKREELICRK